MRRVNICMYLSKTFSKMFTDDQQSNERKETLRRRERRVVLSEISSAASAPPRLNFFCVIAIESEGSKIPRSR